MFLYVAQVIIKILQIIVNYVKITVYNVSAKVVVQNVIQQVVIQIYLLQIIVA